MKTPDMADSPHASSPVRLLSIGASVALALLFGGCADDPAGPVEPEAVSALDARGAQCLAKKNLVQRLQFADAGRASKLLRRSDDWARQLSAFERSARRRTLEPTSKQELLGHVSAQGLDWTASEEEYWQGIVDRLSAAMEGLGVQIPHLRLVKTTGLDEFNAAYHRNGAIVLPQERVSLAGGDFARSDFFLLAHELWHALSSDDHRLRRAMYELLGFQRFREIEPPTELESRRLSNPDGHTYEDALAVQTPDGPADVVPFVRSDASLEEVIVLPTEGPPAIFGVLDIVLIPVDTGTGDIVRGPGGELVTYGFGNTNWVPQLLRNTNFIIHPEEIMADNFASLMEWRDSGVVPMDNPSGFPINDVDLLSAIEDVMTRGCGA